MPLDVKNLRSNTAKLAVYYTLTGKRQPPDEELNLVYKPYGSTVDKSKEAAVLIDEEKMEALVDSGIEQTLEVVVEWDLVSGGQPVPLTLEGILEAEVPQQVFQDIGEAIRKASKKLMGERRGLGRSRG